MPKESIGNMQVCPPRRIPESSGYTTGITYRQWLIGMIASDMCKYGWDTEMHPDQITEAIITTADAIISQLDKEENNG